MQEPVFVAAALCVFVAGILVGSLGYAVGTFLGFAVVEFGLNFL